MLQKYPYGMHIFFGVERPTHMVRTYPYVKYMEYPQKSWMKIVHFLLEYTNTTNKNFPSTAGEINEKMKLFRSNLVSNFKKW